MSVGIMSGIHTTRPVVVLQSTPFFHSNGPRMRLDPPVAHSVTQSRTDRSRLYHGTVTVSALTRVTGRTETQEGRAAACQR